MTVAHLLDEGLIALGLDLPLPARTRLMDYLDLLRKWNRTYNLTAIRDESAIVTHHLLDSLSILSVPESSASVTRRWADIGSGAGLPGIPLAIACPDLQMTLVEAVEKKAAFQRQVKIELTLENITIAASRVETVEGGCFDIVVSRAFAELADFVRLAGHLVAPGGQLYAMKGHATQVELDGLPASWQVRSCNPLRVPGVDARRHLIILEKV